MTTTTTTKRKTMSERQRAAKAKVQRPPLFVQGADIPSVAAFKKADHADPVLYERIFCPWSTWAWYIGAASADTKKVSTFDDDVICYGYVIGQESEWGHFSIRELESVRGPMCLRLERDINFSPCKFSELKLPE